MQHDGGRPPVRSDFERQLRIDYLVEEVALRLRENLGLWLSGELREESAFFPADGEERRRSELIAADVAFEDRGVDSDRRPRFRLRPQRNLPVQQVAADVVHASRCSGIRERDDCRARPRVEADERSIAGRAAVVPDDVVAVGRPHMPAQGDLERGRAPAGRRAVVIAAKAFARGVGRSPIAADKNSSRSLTVDRSAPAPARVGKSQLDAGCSVAS